MTHKSAGDRAFVRWVNSLNDEQVKRLYQIIAPISDDERAMLDKLSDDELLAEL